MSAKGGTLYKYSQWKDEVFYGTTHYQTAVQMTSAGTLESLSSSPLMPTQVAVTMAAMPMVKSAYPRNGCSRNGLEKGPF
jgi:hypothetical protein